MDPHSYGTAEDAQGMIRLGKKQELRRSFQFFSIWGFAVILGCSWEYVLVYRKKAAGNKFSLTDSWVVTASFPFLMEEPEAAFGSS